MKLKAVATLNMKGTDWVNLLSWFDQYKNEVTIEENSESTPKF